MSSQKKLELMIQGMHCIACKQSIEHELRKITGVDSVCVYFPTDKAVIKGNFDDHEILKTIKQLGYKGIILADSHSFYQTTRQTLITYCFVFALIVSLPIWIGVLFPMLALSKWWQCLLASVIQFGFGISFYRSSFYALKNKRANMDVLIMLGTSAAYFFSLVTLLLDLSQPLYFDSSASIITLVLLGRFLETRAKQQAGAAILSLLKLQPQKALIKQEKQWIEVSIDRLQIGDICQVKPGELVPIDSKVIEGVSHVDESLLTGEAHFARKVVGDVLIGGSQNKEGLLVVQVTAVGNHTVLSQMIDLVSHAQKWKAPIEKMTDKICAIFVPVVLITACLTAFIWAFLSSWTAALLNAVSVIIIACPCALGLAVPIVISVAIGKASKMGLLIRNPEGFQKAAKLKVMAIDKTGTLTIGKPKLTSVAPPAILPYLVALESCCKHPLAEAITENRSSDLLVKDFELLPGKGIKGNIEGNNYLLGSIRWMHQEHISIDPIVEEKATSTDTALCLAKEGEFLGFATVSDSLRAEARQTVSALHKRGISTLLLSGDNLQSTQQAAKLVGIESIYANLLPQEKAHLISINRLIGMIGDGINDAPALASADVSFSLATSSDIAKQTADIILMREDLRLIVTAVDLSKAAMKKMGSNLIFAFVYNVAGIGFAAFGWLSPMVAATAMIASSLCVVSNALLLQVNSQSV